MTEAETTQTLVTIGRDGLQRFERVALRSIPELTTGLDPGKVDTIRAAARKEVQDFIAAHGSALASAGIERAWALFQSMNAGDDDDLMTAEEAESLAETSTDAELIAAMDSAADDAEAVAAELAGQIQIIAQATRTMSVVGRAALNAGLAAVLATL